MTKNVCGHVRPRVMGMMVAAVVMVGVGALGLAGVQAAQRGSHYKPSQDRILPDAPAPRKPGTPLKVFHLHIAKTGGRTFRLSFPGIAKLKGGGAPPCCTTDEKLKHHVQHFSKTATQTWLTFETPITDVYDWLPDDTVILTFVRDPVAHTLSTIGHINHWSNGRFQVGKWSWNADHNQFAHYNSTNMQSAHLGGVHAIDNLDRIVTGILELYPESICVFLYEIGRFDKRRCTCGPHGEPPSFDSTDNRAKNAGNRDITDPQMTASYADMRKMRQLSRIDNDLYMAALRVFLQRVKAIEEKTGTTFFCRGALAPNRYGSDG